ncbi:MAG: CRTAC1 family protein, partial [Planctomycetota bacterium]
MNTASETWKLDNPNSLIGSGVALGDVDGDGLVDVYLAHLAGPNALYRNLGDWKFEEIGDAAGVAAPDRLSSGATFGDVDGDGDLDLLVTALGGPNALFLNDGTGTFSDATADAGLDSDRGSTTAALADIDGDGDLDLYIGNYKFPNAEDVFPPAERTFDRVVRRVDGEYHIAPRFREHYRLVEWPAFDLVARVQRADPDWLYLNDGTGRFEAVSFTSGRFLDENGTPLSREPDNFVLSARFYDVDADGDPDLYVCSDFEDPDYFWLNDGSGTFQLVPRLAQRTTSNAAMAVDFADLDRDGDIDFLEVDMLARDHRMQQMQRPSHTVLPKLGGRIDDRPQMQRNTLFVNRSDGTFAQIAEYAGIDASGWSWSTLLLDVDLDGYEDVLMGNGHEWDVQNQDADQRARNRSSRSIWRENILLYPDLKQQNMAFRNNGDLTFSDVSDVWGFNPEPDVSHGMAAGDLDGDGDLDVVVNRLGQPAVLFRNDARARRIAVRLIGTPPNTQGVGAKIRVTGGAVPMQSREVTAGGLYLSDSDDTFAFATGEADSVTIEVVWRSGMWSTVQFARPNRLYEIRESSAGPPAMLEPPAAIDPV